MRSFGRVLICIYDVVAEREEGNGRTSGGYTLRNEGTSFSVQSICAMSITKIPRKNAQFIYTDIIVIFEV